MGLNVSLGSSRVCSVLDVVMEGSVYKSLPRIAQKSVKVELCVRTV